MGKEVTQPAATRAATGDFGAVYRPAPALQPVLPRPSSRGLHLPEMRRRHCRYGV